MRRYFFHLRDGTDQVLDPDGLELRDIQSVKEKALQAARDTLSHELRDEGLINLKYRIDVEDSEGVLVHSLELDQAFDIVRH